MRLASLSFLLVPIVLSTSCYSTSKYYLDKGHSLLKAGKYEEASLNYRRAIQKDPNSADAHFALGISEERQQHIRPAWEELGRALDLAPQRSDIAVELADLCLLGLALDPSRPQVLYQRVKDISSQLLAKDTNSFDGLRFKGYVAIFDKHMDEATASFARAHQVRPNDPDVAVRLVETLFENNQHLEAERVARDFIRSNPSHGPMYDAVYTHYSKTGPITAAEEILKLKVANNPNQPTYATELCRFYWRQGRQREALDSVARMLASPGPQAEKHLAAGDFYGVVERWPESRQQFEEGLRVAPAQRVLFQKRIVDVLLMQGKRTEAAPLVDEILKQQPHDQEANRIRAGWKLDTKDPTEVASAISGYKAALQTTPDAPSLHYDLGRALALKGDVGGAKAEFEKALRLKPDYGAPRIALAELALRLQRLEEALKWCDEAIAINPQDAAPRLLKAVALRTSGQPGKARTELNALLRILPDHPAARLQLALMDIEAKDFKAAEATLKGLQTIDSSGAAGSFAVMYAAQGQLDRAVEMLTKVSLRPENRVLIHNMLGALALHANKYDVAIAEFQALVAADPYSTAPLLRLAEVYRSKGDWGNAIAVLERAQKLAPEDLIPTAWLASSFESTGRLDLALAQYRRAMVLQPNNASIMNNVAYLVVETGGDLDEALQLSQRAVRSVPNEPSFSDTLGWIYLKRKMPDSALQVFSKLVTHNPNDPTFLYHFGEALFETGNRERARATLEAALTKRPSKQQANRIRELLAKLG